MKPFYRIFAALLVLGSSAQAQIQKISYTTAEQQIFKLNRISPAASGQANRMPLDGTWQFSTDANSAPFDKNIQVPGEWVMQGFEVQKDVYAGYKKTFEVPVGWRNKRVKLRFDAVYSEAEIWVNGKKIANHSGGFTPFEIDINDFVKWDGSNELLVKVKSDSKADSLASASTYAVHPLGGLGTNDFRSTKMYINNAQLTNRISTFGVLADGLQHIRAWKNEQGIKALVAGYSNMGTERFFRSHAEKMDRPLKIGDIIQDNINLQLK